VMFLLRCWRIRMFVLAPALVGPPSKTTIWRVLTDADAEAVDAVVGQWLMSLAGFIAPSPADSEGCAALMQVRLDGKTLRGAKDAEGNQTPCSPRWSVALLVPAGSCVPRPVSRDPRP
jgi:hypothetical protein